MAIPLQRQTCVNHPDRFGHAVCMNCRKTVCQTCATTWDGINYCVACLARLRRRSDEKPSLIGWVAVIVAAAAFFYLAQFLMVWGGVKPVA